MTLTFDLSPVVYRARARMRPSGTPVDPRAGALERVVIAPAFSELVPGALSLPDEVDRATATISFSTLSHERRSAQDHVIASLPTVVYRYSNALLAGGCWYANGDYESLRDQRRHWPVLDRAECFAEAQLCTDWTSEKFFGHWLCDGLSMELLASDRQMHGLGFSGAKRIHEAGYRGIVSLQCQAVSIARVRRFWTVDDRGYNQHRADRLLRLRKRLRSAVTPGDDRLAFIATGANASASSTFAA